MPARIPEAAAEEARRLALAAHRALGCRGISRVDMIVGRRRRAGARGEHHPRPDRNQPGALRRAGGRHLLPRAPGPDHRPGPGGPRAEVKTWRFHVSARPRARPQARAAPDRLGAARRRWPWAPGCWRALAGAAHLAAAGRDARRGRGRAKRAQLAHRLAGGASRRAPTSSGFAPAGGAPRRPRCRRSAARRWPAAPPHTVVIRVAEREPVVVSFAGPAGRLYLDRTGYAFNACGDDTCRRSELVGIPAERLAPGSRAG